MPDAVPDAATPRSAHARVGRGPLATAVGGVLLLVVGAFLVGVRPPGTDYGWFAYSGPPDPTPVFWVLTVRQGAGLAVMAVGLAVVAAAGGYAAALRRRP